MIFQKERNKKSEEYFMNKVEVLAVLQGFIENNK